MFAEHEFNAFPVVDANGVLLGIVSKFDVFRIGRHEPARLIPDFRALYAEHVDDIMRRRVVTLRPRDSVTSAIDLMIASKRRSVPVAERLGRADMLRGVVSRTDVIRCVTSVQKLAA
jgi:CBS-domain-containing membrane protein